MVYKLDNDGSFYSSVTGSSQDVGTLDANETYVINSTVDLWFKIADSGSAASRTAGNHLVLAGQAYPVITSDSGMELKVIKDDDMSNGHCSVSKVE